MKRDWNIFVSSVFFVLGFSVVFSLLGVLLQTVLANISSTVQIWLGRFAGVVIILFGLYLIGLINPRFLQKEHKIIVKGKSKSSYLTSFTFGAAFAIGWTPCVGAVLGAVLGLAVAQPGLAFLLLLSYSFGLGVPFLLVGLFINQAEAFMKRSYRWIKPVQQIFGVIIVLLGILIFVNQLSRIANFPFVADLLININISAGINIEQSFSMGVAFVAGLISFLSPCVMPLIPAFLAYLASVSTKKE